MQGAVTAPRVEATMRRIPLAAASCVALALAAGCSEGPQGKDAKGGTPAASTPSPTPTAPPPIEPVPTPQPPSRLQVRAVQGLYLLDGPLAGEASVDGSVEVRLLGDAPPVDTTVTLNGTPLVARPLAGLARVFWAVDPDGPQPPPSGDGALTLEARGGGEVKRLVLPCPADLAVTSSTPAGASLSTTATLTLGWAAPLPANALNVFPSDFYPSALLRGLDVAARTPSVEAVSHRVIPRQATSVVLDVGATDLGGYLAELSWPGKYVLDGTSAGFCGRVKRLVYAR